MIIVESTISYYFVNIRIQIKAFLVCRYEFPAFCVKYGTKIAYLVSMKIAKGIAAITYSGISFLGIGLGIIFLELAFPGPGYAQVTNATGTIQGTITDSSGSALPDAQVTVTQPSTVLTKVVVTNSSGYYS